DLLLANTAFFDQQKGKRCHATHAHTRTHARTHDTHTPSYNTQDGRWAHSLLMGTGFCRQLVAFVEAAEGDANAQLFDELVGFLEKNQELKLHRTAREEAQGRRVVFYDQGNAKV